MSVTIRNDLLAFLRTIQTSSNHLSLISTDRSLSRFVFRLKKLQFVRFYYDALHLTVLLTSPFTSWRYLGQSWEGSSAV